MASAWHSPSGCSPRRFNRPGHAIVDHHTYVFVGDGCLMEGISHEACSLAGTLALGKLIVLYDDNGISIDGPTAGWFTDDTPRRFEAYGWHVVPGVDGHDVDAVSDAIAAGKAQADRPTLICCRTIIGKGAPTKAGTADTHGAALGEREVAATRAALEWPYPPFSIPQPIYDAWNAKPRGDADERDWSTRFARYAAAFPDLAAEFTRRTGSRLPETFAESATRFVRAQAEKGETIATRKASQQAIEAYAKALPEMIGGSADLTGSVFTNWSGSVAVTASQAGELCQLRRARVRNGGDRQRPRAARRIHSVRGNVPDVLRLHAQRRPHGRADEAALDLRVHARFDRPRRGWAYAPVDRARGEPAAHTAARRLEALRYRRDGGCLEARARAA